MLPFIIAAPLVVGGLVGGGFILCKSLPEKSRRSFIKRTTKTILRGAQAAGEQFPSMKEDIEDAIAESRYEDSHSQVPVENVDTDNAPGVF